MGARAASDTVVSRTAFPGLSGQDRLSVLIAGAPDQTPGTWMRPGTTVCLVSGAIPGLSGQDRLTGGSGQGNLLDVTARSHPQQEVGSLTDQTAGSSRGWFEGRPLG